MAASVWTPSRSQIYKVLPRLVANGLARVREVEQRGRPDKALYEVVYETRNRPDWIGVPAAGFERLAAAL